MKYIAASFTFVWLLAVPFLAVADSSLYLTPESGSYSVGDVFDVAILLDSGGELISAAEAELRFEPKGLSIEAVTTDGSIFTTWPGPPTFSNTQGVVRFAGWAGEPFTGDDGLLLTVTFRALRNSLTNAHLAAGAILAADDQGSNIISSMRSGIYAIEPRSIVASSAGLGTVALGDAVGEVDTTASLTPQEITTPIFEEVPVALAPGERIIVQGKTEPNAQVILELQKESEEIERFQLASTGEGDFTFVSGGGAEQGTYHVWAEAQKDGVHSVRSKQVAFNVSSQNVSQTALTGAAILSTATLQLALAVLVGIILGFVISRFFARPKESA